MNKELREQAKAKGFGTIKKVLHTATILHNGWEMDNKAWIVEIESGEVIALTTSHGGLYRWTRDEAEKKLAETERCAASVRKALAIWQNALAQADAACGVSPGAMG